MVVVVLMLDELVEVVVVMVVVALVLGDIRPNGVTPLEDFFDQVPT